MKQRRPDNCPICGNSKLLYKDTFWNCKECDYQFVLKDPNFSERYYQEDIGLLAQNILEGKDSKPRLRKYATFALEKYKVWKVD